MIKAYINDNISEVLTLKVAASMVHKSPSSVSHSFKEKTGKGLIQYQLHAKLEHAKKRGATILGEVVGYGATGDAFHITSPNPEGIGAASAMTIAMRHAGINPEDIDYVNAHGTSTGLNDKYETKAIKRAFGEFAKTVSISSTKGTTGHGLGAAGAFESIACLKAIQNSLIPPTINYETPDPDCDLDYTPNKAKEKAVKFALNVNLGFGGHNGALLFKRFEG